LELERERAKQRMSEAGKIGADLTNVGVSSNELTSKTGQARDVVAKRIGVSPTTFQRFSKPLRDLFSRKMLYLDSYRTIETVTKLCR